MLFRVKGKCLKDGKVISFKTDIDAGNVIEAVAGARKTLNEGGVPDTAINDIRGLKSDGKNAIRFGRPVDPKADSKPGQTAPAKARK